MAEETPLVVAIMNDFDVVVAGLAAILDGYPERIQVIEATTGRTVDERAEIVLFDTFGRGEGDAENIAALLARSSGSRIVVYSWNTSPSVVQRALAMGAHGYIDKGLSADDLVAAIEAIHDGETVVPDVGRHRPLDEAHAWPGKEQGLTAREAEVLACIVAGMRNPEIARALSISPNSLKTHIRHIFRKTGADHRVHAVLWGIRHGLQSPRASAEGDG